MRARTLLVVALLLTPTVASARSEQTPVALEAGFGYASQLDDFAFLITAALPVRIATDLDLGPLLQLGLDPTGPSQKLVAPSLDVRYSFPLSRYLRDESPMFDRLRTLVHGGVGLAYLRDNTGGQLGALVNVGLGVQYDWTDRLAFGSQITFNALPGKTLPEDYFFSWQLAHLRYRF